MDHLAYPSWTQMPLIFPPTLSIPVATFVTAVFLVSILVYSLQEDKFSKLPLVNPRKPFEFSDSRAKHGFAAHSYEILARGFSTRGDKPFRVISDAGDTTVLSPRFANEIRNDSRLSFTRITARVCCHTADMFSPLDPPFY